MFAGEAGYVCTTISICYLFISPLIYSFQLVTALILKNCHTLLFKKKKIK